MPPEPHETASFPGKGMDQGTEDTFAHVPASPVPGLGGRAAGRPAGMFERGRASFRAWRRSRPFWGGLLLILAGLELLAIPLLSLLIHAAVKVVIYVGIAGVFGILFGGLLVACGLLAWFHPVQRVFYAIVGVLLALGSFIVTNLGGFFLGMLLGVVGASLMFGWAPVAPREGARPRHRHDPAELPRGDGLDAVLGERRPGSPDRGSRLLALPAVPLLVLGLAATGQAPAAAASGCALSVLCPSPSATASSPAPAAAAPTPSAGTAIPSPSGIAGIAARPSPGKSANRNASKKATAAPALTAAAVPARLTAGSALMTGLSYDGVATVPTASGAQRMLKFSMSSLSLSGGIVLTITEGSHTQVTRNTSVDFSGHVVLYATKLSGKLLGVPLTFTPSNPPPAVLPTMRFTDVVTDQPVTVADNLHAPGLDIRGH